MFQRVQVTGSYFDHVTQWIAMTLESRLIHSRLHCQEINIVFSCKKYVIIYFQYNSTYLVLNRKFKGQNSVMNQVNAPCLVEGMCNLEARVLITCYGRHHDNMVSMHTQRFKLGLILLFSNLPMTYQRNMIFPAPLKKFLVTSPQLDVCFKDTSQ